MSNPYPYQARSLMRFQAQDGQFTLNTDQVVTVTAPTPNTTEWLDVLDEHGASGSIPAGFLVPIKQDTHQGTDRQLGLDDPSVSDDPVQSDDRLPSPSSITPASLEQPSRDASDVSNSQALPSLPVNQASPLTQVASHDSFNSQTPIQSPTPPKDPPSIAKPNALRDRIAMFNKAAPPAVSPSNIHPKPLIARKPINVPPPVPSPDATQETMIAPIISQDDEITRMTTRPGMSAADAEESVKASGSLKDRIRLLQQQQTVASEASPTSPKPRREWKRPPPPPTDEPGLPIPIGLAPSIQHEVVVAGDEPTNHPDIERVASPINDHLDTEAEEEELVRRQKIAERMAKLGGAKMGFGFPGLVPGPKPKVSPKESIADEPLIGPPIESTTEESFNILPPERITMPIIPKRAPPPRRKAPGPAHVPTSSGASLADAESVADQAPSQEDPAKSYLPTNSAAPLEDAAQDPKDPDSPLLQNLSTQASDTTQLSTHPQRQAPSLVGMSEVSATDPESSAAPVTKSPDSPINLPGKKSVDDLLGEESPTC